MEKNTSTKKLNAVNLSKETIFAPSPSMDAIMKIKGGETLRIWLYMRGEYAAFLSKEQSKNKPYDNTLTIYKKTEAKLAEELDVSCKTIQRALDELVSVGLVVQIPFEKKNAEGKTMRRNNLVVLDCALTDYFDFLKGCKKIIEAYRNKAPRNTRGVAQLEIINKILSEKEEKGEDKTEDAPSTEKIEVSAKEEENIANQPPTIADQLSSLPATPAPTQRIQYHRSTFLPNKVEEEEQEYRPSSVEKMLMDAGQYIQRTTVVPEIVNAFSDPLSPDFAFEEECPW